MATSGLTCWECEGVFQKSDAEIGWAPSAFEGEMVEAYECPHCGVLQYGIEVDKNGR